MNDFDLVCAIGSGTCGEVSKMKHKPTGRVLAVKVSDDKNITLMYFLFCSPFSSLLGHFRKDPLAIKQQRLEVTPLAILDIVLLSELDAGPSHSGQQKFPG